MTNATRRAILKAGLAATAAVQVAVPASVSAQAPPSPVPDAIETARLIRSGAMSGKEVLEAAARRMDAAKDLNATLAPRLSLALEALDRPDKPVGVPTLIKDLYDIVGSPTGQGSAAYSDAAPATRQGALISRLAGMGLLAIGKSTTPEFGLLPVTEPKVTGPAVNPWNRALSPGGSSGGAAVAVAAGIVPLAHASDGGGSIRIPAACTGLFGFKPSRGRTVGSPRGNRVTDVTVSHVITRSVRDSALVLAGAEPPTDEQTYPAIGIIAEPIKQRLKVGVLTQSMVGKEPDADVKAAITATVALLEGLGHTVAEARWPVDGTAYARDFLSLWAIGAQIERNSVEKAKGKDGVALLEPFTLALAEDADGLNALQQLGIVNRLNTATRRYADWFKQHDVILCPVLLSASIRSGSIDQTKPYDTLVAELTDLVGYTPLMNTAGAPAMSIPLNWTAAGLPVGVQFAAKPGDDATLLGLALELEAAKPWAGRRPPIWFGA